MKTPGLKMLFTKDSSFIKMMVKRVPELATIIISILLALSIESWADNRKDHNRLQTYYENISSEILRDTTAMTEIMDDAQKRIDDCRAF